MRGEIVDVCFGQVNHDATGRTRRIDHRERTRIARANHGSHCTRGCLVVRVCEYVGDFIAREVRYRTRCALGYDGSRQPRSSSGGDELAAKLPE